MGREDSSMVLAQWRSYPWSTSDVDAEHGCAAVLGAPVGEVEVGPWGQFSRSTTTTATGCVIQQTLLL